MISKLARRLLLPAALAIASIATQDATFAQNSKLNAMLPDDIRKAGAPMAEVALAWLLQKPAIVTPVAGATKPEPLWDTAAAVSLKPTAEEAARLEEPYIPHAIAGL